jgi:hypothetical protein
MPRPEILLLEVPDCHATEHWMVSGERQDGHFVESASNLVGLWQCGQATVCPAKLGGKGILSLQLSHFAVILGLSKRDYALYKSFDVFNKQA